MKTCVRCTDLTLDPDTLLCGLCKVDLLLWEPHMGVSVPRELWPIEGLRELGRAAA